MKRPKGSPDRHRRATPPARWSRLLAAFERSGLSAAAFARRHGIRYTTFCGWRQRQITPPLSPAFVQVEVSAPIAPAELLLELGGPARLRLNSPGQIDLAVELLRRLNAPAPC
jgi:hypothetical protein